MSAGFMVKRVRLANRQDGGQSSEFHLQVARVAMRHPGAARGQLKLELRAAKAGRPNTKRAGKSFPAEDFQEEDLKRN